ncbi:peptidoglycan-binding protein [Phormidium tenue FACHB-886]|nr:peptidoglycan-binding protein [Phormidium tenue FACHB-886]
MPVVNRIDNPVLQLGASGSLVRELQQLLNLFEAKLSVDGNFGTATRQAVIAFQSGFGVRAGLPVTGVVETRTWSLLYARVFDAAPNAMPMLQRGSKGHAVQTLQLQLRSSHLIEIDGDFGGATEAIVRDVQKKANLLVDGVVGSKTWRAIHQRSRAV